MTERTISSDSIPSWSSDDQKRKHRTNKSRPPSPATKVMRAIKRHFHGHSPATFQVAPEAPTYSSHAQVLNGSISKLQRSLSAANKAGALLGMCINRTDGKGRKEVEEIKAVWVDIDGGFDPEQFSLLKPKPSLIVETSPGRGHVFFDVSDCSVEFYPLVQRALAQKFGGDLNVTDPGRAVRLGGTLHHKKGPHLTRLIYLAKKYKPTAVKKLITQLGLTIQPPSGTSMASCVEAKVRSAAACIPPSDERRYWLKIGMAIHDALPNEIGRSIWTEWSRKSPKFDERDQLRNWESFKKGARTVATLYKEATKNGWKEFATEADLGWEATEFGVVDEFARRARNRMCYDFSRKHWLVFGEHVWQPDQPGVIAQARSILQSMIADAKLKGVEAAHKLLKKYASVPGIRSLLMNATAQSTLNVQVEQFDAQPDLLAVENGVVDLATGKLRPGVPDDMLLRRAPVEFDSTATSAKFLKFIDFVTQGDAEYASYLQRAAGGSMFGHAGDQALYYLVGKGGNGKGAFIRRLEAVLGPHVVAIAPNLLTKAYAGNPQGPTPAFMALQGARIIQCGEGEERKRFDTAFIKQLTGNDKITGRAGYGEQAQFTPICTPWLSANALPEIDYQDEAMWRRVRILPFRAKVKKPSLAFEGELDVEKAGILNWLIAGALAYKKHGLGTCSAVESATRRAKRKGDSVQAWIDDRCKSKSSAQVQATIAFQDYAAYCRKNERHSLSVHAFKRALIKKGYRAKKTKQYNIYSGLMLIE